MTRYSPSVTIHRVKWRHISVVAMRSPFVGQQVVLCVVKWWGFDALFESNWISRFKKMSVLSLSYWESDIYWRQNNKHFAELALQNGGKQLIWRNYVTVTLCIGRIYVHSIAVRPNNKFIRRRVSRRSRIGDANLIRIQLILIRNDCYYTNKSTATAGMGNRGSCYCLVTPTAGQSDILRDRYAAWAYKGLLACVRTHIDDSFRAL